MSSSSSPCTYVQSLWDILATIIHLGNVTFKEDSKGFAEFGSTEQLDCIAKVNMYVCTASGTCVRTYVLGLDPALCPSCARRLEECVRHFNVVCAVVGVLLWIHVL